MLYAGNKRAVLNRVARTVFEVRGLSVHRGEKPQTAKTAALRYPSLSGGRIFESLEIQADSEFHSQSGDGDVTPMDAIDFGVGPYDRREAGDGVLAVDEAYCELLAGSRRLAGRGDQPFEQRDESQTFDCTERDWIAVPVGSWPLLRVRQDGHDCQPDHGSDQQRPTCGYDFGGDFERSAFCCQRSHAADDGAGGRHSGGHGGVQSDLEHPLHCIDKRNVECRGRFAGVPGVRKGCKPFCLSPLESEHVTRCGLQHLSEHGSRRSLYEADAELGPWYGLERYFSGGRPAVLLCGDGDRLDRAGERIFLPSQRPGAIPVNRGERRRQHSSTKVRCPTKNSRPRRRERKISQPRPPRPSVVWVDSTYPR